MTEQKNPEIGNTIMAGGIAVNYHDMGSGYPVVLIHGSGPGVTAPMIDTSVSSMQ